MELKLSSKAENYLLRIAKERDVLIHEDNLSILKTFEKLGKISKKTKQNYETLKLQLPMGIYVRAEHIIEHINSMLQKTKRDALSYSPFVLNYPELKCCKPMKYRTGNIITGRDKEIEDILLSFTKSAKRGVILVGEPGVGKSLPITAPVLIHGNRWCLNGKLKIGDKIINASGKESNILGIFPQGKQDTYKITFKDGRSTLCTKEHLWKVYSKNWKRLGSESRIIELDLIKQIKDKTREKLYIDLYTPEETPKINLVIDPYILGVLLGDGSIITAPTFTNQSEELINNIETRLLSKHTLTKSKSRNTYSLRICSDIRTENAYWNELNNLHLAGKYSYEKFIPEEYKQGSIQQREDLIAGLLDTDGSVGANGSVLYYTTSEQLANDVCYIIRSLGGIAKITNKKTHYKHNDIIKQGRQCYVVSIRYKNSKNLFKLSRKKDKLPKNYQYDNLKLEIISVQQEGNCECACIYIDHPDHLYITNDFIVTHNTAIVRAVNNKLIERTVPRQLNGSYILNLDIPYVFSKFKEDPIGTIIRVLDRASENDKIILFIDEVHQLLGHRMNDVMKPYLTEQIRFIGSTTIDEYHSIITDDRALERRFTLIPVDEPNVERTQKMMINTKSIYEEHHKCIIPDAVCEYAVINGSRFLGHRKNPDKSLDLLDVACSIMYEKEITTKDNPLTHETFTLKGLESRKKNILDFTEVTGDRTLSIDYIDMAISSLTGIPFGEIKNSLNYLQVVTNITSKVFGQEEQIKSIANVVNIFKHVKADRKRPVSVLLLVGPPGVGKASTCSALAKNLYGKEQYFIDYDMTGLTSEFMITELKGAPPGYVGYQKSGKLVKQIRNNPQSVIYFRGINKAHETIQQYIVDACRHGMLTDSAERVAPLNNAIIVYSVTLNDEEYNKVFKQKSKTMGFAIENKDHEEKQYNEAALKEIVGEELTKAADELIVFNSLDENILNQIFDANVNECLELYDVDVDLIKLKEVVLKDSKHGRDVISKLSSEVPKFVFKKLKQE